ncbi:MAG: hypothetical protein JWQ07_2179 [Ramlibacter sp.]|nr:hypothetical protein [Ramlibacter sp.]
MNYQNLIRTAACAATLALGAGGVLAQVTAPVVTDVAPPPAEERGSTGAIVLENSLVRAQRDRDFERTSSRTGVMSVGRGILRETMKAQAQADLAQAREAEAVELYRRGSGGMTGR